MKTKKACANHLNSHMFRVCKNCDLPRDQHDFRPKPRAKRRFKGGFRNNGQPRITLPRGLTRVAQLKATLRGVLRAMSGTPMTEAGNKIQEICWQGLDGTYCPPHLRGV